MTRRQWGCPLKVNLHSFSLYRNYSYLVTLSNEGEPSWSWILQVQKEKLNFVVACLRPPKNAELGIFTSWSCKNGQRNVQKSVVDVQSCCFAYKTYGLFDVLVAVPVVGSWSERPRTGKARRGGALIQRTRWLACVGFNECSRGTLARRGEEAYWLFTIYKKIPQISVGKNSKCRLPFA